MAKFDLLDQKMGTDDISLKKYTAEAYKPQSSPYINSIYTESPAVTQAKLNLQNQLKDSQSQYKGSYADKIMSLIDNMGNNQPANMNTQQFRQEYVGNISKGAQDTLMNLAKLSGGYGNTYAGAVADQQKQAGMLNINDINPALMQLSQSVKQGEKNDLYNLLQAYQAQDNTEYGRHRDSVTDRQAEIDRLTDLYLSHLQRDREDFETDRGFNQGAFEFTQGQKQSAFENYQDRLQSQVQEDNDNALTAWGKTWDNYWNAQDINEANKQNALDEEYQSYQLLERAKSIAEAEAKAKAKAKAEDEKKKNQKDDESETVNLYEYESSKGVDKFLKEANVMTRRDFLKHRGGYSGYDNYEDYLDSKLDDFTYATSDVSGEIKLTDHEKKYLQDCINWNDKSRK